MKHGIKLRKLGRTSSHRSALLRCAFHVLFFPLEAQFILCNNRNLVAALLHHEQIQTTVPKAKEAARVAEKVGHACGRGLWKDRLEQGYKRSAGNRLQSSGSGFLQRFLSSKEEMKEP